MQSKAEEAYEKIKRKIVTLEMKPSSDISEEALIRELNISRTPIREAIQRLAKDRFVIVYPRKGTIVSEITMELVNSVYEVRLLNEPFMARAATAKVSDQWIAQMKEAFLVLEPTSFNISHYIQLDHDLHSELTRHTDNLFLHNLFLIINDHSHRIRIQTSNRNQFYRKSVAEHLEILDALEKRDPDFVEQVVRSHIETGRSEAHLFGVM